MNHQERLRSDITDYDKAIEIYAEVLEYAKEHNVIGDIEFYTCMIQFMESKKEVAEAELQQLKSA